MNTRTDETPYLPGNANNLALPESAGRWGPPECSYTQDRRVELLLAEESQTLRDWPEQRSIPEINERRLPARAN